VDHKEFVDAVAQRSGLTRQEAVDLTNATLEALAQRLSGGEVRQLAMYLPEPLTHSLKSREQGAAKFGLYEFIQKVREHTGLTESETTEGVRAVLTTLRDAVPEDEFKDVMSQLPRDFSNLLAPAT
jgi:uncharacterized protein (DUF2267 family)